MEAGGVEVNLPKDSWTAASLLLGLLGQPAHHRKSLLSAHEVRCKHGYMREERQLSQDVLREKQRLWLLKAVDWVGVLYKVVQYRTYSRGWTVPSTQYEVYII